MAGFSSEAEPGGTRGGVPMSHRMLSRLAVVLSLCMISGFGVSGPAVATGPAHAPDGKVWPSVTGQANWPQFRDHADHDGYNATEDVLSPGTVGALGADWEFQSGG